MMTRAAIKILNQVWYAKPHIQDGHINFAGIDEEITRIVPSTTEILMVDLARHLHTMRGQVDIANLLAHADLVNRAVIIDALTEASFQ